jgi:hypothetical protein
VYVVLQRQAVCNSYNEQVIADTNRWRRKANDIRSQIRASGAFQADDNDRNATAAIVNSARWWRCSQWDSLASRCPNIESPAVYLPADR